MVVVQKADGGIETVIGSFNSGYPTTNSWGQRIPDMGIPLTSYQPRLVIDPLVIWRTQPSVRKVVGFAAEQLASVPWRAYLSVGDEDLRHDAASPAEKLLLQPGRFTSGFSLMRNLAIDRMIYDVWCVVLGEDDKGNPKLVRIPPRLLDIRSNFIGEVVTIYMRSSTGELIDMTDAPMAISWGWADAAGGISPLHGLAQTLTDYSRSLEWRNAQWENSPKFSGVLKRPKDAGKWDETKRDRFIKTWKEWRDTNKTGTPILEDGMDYEPLEAGDPQSMRDIEFRQATDLEVCGVFHIAPELIGSRPGTFSSISAFRQMLFGPTLGPIFEEFKQVFNAMLLPEIDSRDGIFIEQDRDAALNGTAIEQAKVLSAAVGGPWMTRNEARRRSNLQAIDGGDDLITPLNVVTGGQASPLDSGTQNEGADQAIPAAPATASLMFTLGQVADTQRQLTIGE
jgi:HK97 family phage portal protein